MICEHENFAANVSVARLTRGDTGPVTGFMAEITIQCADCGRRFQFLGMEPGIDIQGARVTIDGLEAHIAICPQGAVPSPLDRIVANFKPERTN